MPLIDVFAPGKREEFHKLGDINRDGVIDQADLALLQASWGSKSGDPNWNPDCDLNGDGVVNVLDLGILSRNYGKDIWSWLRWPSQGVVEWSIIGGSVAGILAVGIAAYMAFK